MVRKLRMPLVALFLALTGNAAGQSFFLVTIPPLGRRLGFSDLQGGLLVGLSALLLVISAPVWGFASERIGRRRVLLVSLTAAALALAGCALVIHLRSAEMLAAGTAFVCLFVVRLFQSAISGGLLPAAQAYMADTTAPGERARGMGMLGAAYGVGAILGAAAAWRLGGTAPVLALSFLAGVIAIGLFLVALFLQEPSRPVDARADDPTHLPLNHLWPFFTVTLLALTVYSVIQQTIGLRFEDSFAMSTAAAISRAGAAVMAASVVMTLVQLVGLRLLNWKPERLLMSGAVLAILALALLTLADTLLMVFAAMVILGIALGLMLPGNLACLSLRAGQSSQGKAAGINAVGQGFGMAAGPILGAGLHQLAPVAPSGAALGLLFAIVLLAWFATRPTSALGAKGATA